MTILHTLLVGGLSGDLGEDMNFDDIIFQNIINPETEISNSIRNALSHSISAI